MTPILLMFGYPASVAIGTDLLYASITKAGGALSHHQSGNVNWSIVRLLAFGSVPTAILVHAVMIQTAFQDTPKFEQLLTFSLGIMLIITAIILILRNKMREKAAENRPPALMHFIQRRRSELTFLMGIVLGVCVTLSSVGAGAFAAAILLTMYSQAKTVQIVGSDIAHAVPLTFIAGLGYLLAGHVDLMLLLSLLIGSLPAIALGSRLSNRLPEQVLQGLLTVILLGLGLYYTLTSKIH